MFPEPQDPRNPQNTPQPTPQYGVNSAPQQADNGQYAVVPPPSITGHPTGHNVYEFIVNPNNPQKSGGLFKGNKFLQKIAVLVGGTVLLLTVLGILISVFVPNNNSTATLTSIAQQQQEIIRVATLGARATSQDTQNFAATTQYTLMTSQGQVITYLGQHGTKLSAKQLAVGHDATTDATLTAATATSTFDSALKDSLISQLKTYRAALSKAYTASSNKTVKTLLQKSDNSARILLGISTAQVTTDSGNGTL